MGVRPVAPWSKPLETGEEASLVGGGQLGRLPPAEDVEAPHPGAARQPLERRVAPRAPVDSCGGGVVGNADHGVEQDAVRCRQTTAFGGQVVKVGDEEHRLDEARRDVANPAAVAVELALAVYDGEGNEAIPRARVAAGCCQLSRTRQPGGGREPRPLRPDNARAARAGSSLCDLPATRGLIAIR